VPDVPAAEGNPVILYFLEHDVREMKRLTRGSEYHFRKRIRMAVYQGATVRELKLPYRGAAVAVKEFSISPYVDDPNRPKFPKLAGKRYAFYVSDAVPGGLYAIRTRIDGTDPDGAPLMQEDMLLEGGEPPPLAARP